MENLEPTPTGQVKADQLPRGEGLEVVRLSRPPDGGAQQAQLAVPTLGDGGRCVRPTLGCDQVDRQSAVSWAEPPGDDPDDIRRLPAAQPGLPYRGKARSEEYAL